MGLAQARYNSAETNGRFHLRAAVGIEPLLDSRNSRIIGECGHRLLVISGAKWELDDWAERIETKKRHRKRCWSCPKD